MKKIAMAVLALSLGSVALAGESSWQFSLSNGTPAVLTVNDGYGACGIWDPKNRLGKVVVGSLAISVDVCTGKDGEIEGIYTEPSNPSMGSGLAILKGPSMDSQMSQLFKTGFLKLGNGIGGVCPESTDALLSITGSQIGDAGIAGYCLFKN